MPGAFRAKHRNHAKARPDRKRSPPAEYLANAVGDRVGGHVIVFRQLTHELIAYAAAGPQRLMAALAEAAHHVHGKLTSELGIDGGQRTTRASG